MSGWLQNLKKLFSPEGREFYFFVKGLIGYWPKPSSMPLFAQSFVHKSIVTQGVKKKRNRRHNERLEYLGDALMGSIVAEILYSIFPDADEGTLSRYRADLVNRKSLNKKAVELCLDHRVLFNSGGIDIRQTHVTGDVLEAFLAAIYLDGGYKRAWNFVRRRIANDAQVAVVVKNREQVIMQKSLLLEWGQKNHVEVLYETHKMDSTDDMPDVRDDFPAFETFVWVGGEQIATGRGRSKKAAENEAAETALRILRKTEMYD